MDQAAPEDPEGPVDLEAQVDPKRLNQVYLPSQQPLHNGHPVPPEDPGVRGDLAVLEDQAALVDPVVPVGQKLQSQANKLNPRNRPVLLVDEEDPVDLEAQKAQEVPEGLGDPVGLEAPVDQEGQVRGSQYFTPRTT